MKYTVIGDPHVTPDNLDLARSIFLRAESLGHPVIWLGDMLDTKEKIRGKCLNFWIDNFSESELHHTILVGNHDWFNHDCLEHSLVALSKLPNVTIVDEFYAPENDPNVHFIPYKHTEADVKKMLKDSYAESGDTIGEVTLFGHLELKNFDWGTGKMCDEGLTTRSFKKFRRVITGHFHKFQESENVMYLGTPYSLNFGETNQIKYIAEFESETGEVELFDTNLRQHLTLEHNVSEGFLELDPKNIYRVNLIGTQEEIELWDRPEIEGLNVKYVACPTDSVKMSVDIDENLSNEDQWIKWAQDIEGLDQTKIDLGLNILGEASA